jgi:prevent-host-death family protein
MRTIGMHDAKRRFGALLAAVDRGETFLITRYGIPVAYIEPMPSAVNDAAATEVLERDTTPDTTVKTIEGSPESAL